MNDELSILRQSYENKSANISIILATAMLISSLLRISKKVKNIYARGGFLIQTNS